MPKKASIKKTTRDAKAVVKQTKKQSRQIVKTSKTAVKTVKKLAKVFSKPSPKANQNKQTKSQPKRKQQSPSKSTSKKQSTSKSPKKSSTKIFDLKKLSGKRFKSPLEFVNYAETHEDEIDSQLHNPDVDNQTEFFVATFFGNRTVIPYSSIRPLVRKLNSYITEIHEPDSKLDGLHSIKVMKLNTTTTKFMSEREQIVEARKLERESIIEEAKQTIGAKNPVTKKRNSVVDLLKGSLNSLAEERKARESAEKRLSDLEKQFAEFLKKVAAPVKKSKKKSTKKAVKNVTRGQANTKGKTKSGGSKKQSSKSTGKVATKKKGVISKTGKTISKPPVKQTSKVSAKLTKKASKKRVK